ncbi:c-type cytochrome [Falsirhodobacter algicola]|uniref:C-type cytochrome n=1 Tax=Falsirhodobacter algicola TaxID=2692330 RepID=A0A8J8MR86_9RHOB|nr:c-type cytochrome [Falsirhodobacter algicola]QUS35265.1 c-type cytochrome [Falsirhodobacter algicola]
MTRWRTVLATIAVLASLGALGGFAVVLFGLYDTSAQKGHWKVTDWVLHTTFRNSVDLRAADDPPPVDLDDPGLILLGARHYDSACRMCHAAPGEMASATIDAMVPRPPQIERAVGTWVPQELHWIVHEGVKMSGMPAWPAEGRGDEVWAVVAFLRAVQGGMDGARYQGLTGGERYCSGCHASGSDHIPKLEGLSAEYLAASLRAYRSGARPSGIMAQAASGLEDGRIDGMAQRMGGQDRPADPAAEALPGAMLARRGQGEVPGCLACHGAGNDNPMIPKLDGQPAPYLATQLRLWRAGERGGTDRAPLMEQAARGLTDREIEDLAAYFAAR